MRLLGQPNTFLASRGGGVNANAGRARVMNLGTARRRLAWARAAAAAAAAWGTTAPLCVDDADVVEPAPDVAVALTPPCVFH